MFNLNLKPLASLCIRAEEIALLSARRHSSVAYERLGGAAQPRLPLRLFTAYIDEVKFKDKAEVGDRISLTSQCCRSFGGILEVEVKAEASKAHEEPRVVNVAYFSIAGVDGTGTPLVFADVLPETDEQRNRYAQSQGRMLVAAIKANSLSAQEPPPDVEEDALLSPGVRRTASAAVMSSTFSFTLLKRAQISSIWNAAEAVSSNTEQWLALAHSCFTTLAKTADDAQVACDFEQSALPQFADVALKLRQGFSGAAFVAAVEVCASKQAVAALVAMGLGKWNALFDEGRDHSTVEAPSLSMTVTTVSTRNGVASFRALQARHDTLDSHRTIVALRGVSSAASAAANGSSSSSSSCMELLQSGFVLEAVDEGRTTRVMYVREILRGWSWSKPKLVVCSRWQQRGEQLPGSIAMIMLLFFV